MRLMAIAILLLVGNVAMADAPSGSGQASWWVSPCTDFVIEVESPSSLSSSQVTFAALCQGFMTAVAAVNYANPPYLPFCVRGTDTPYKYAKLFVRFMLAHPEYSDKNIGLEVLVALASARPRSECSR